MRETEGRGGYERREGRGNQKTKERFRKGKGRRKNGKREEENEERKVEMARLKQKGREK